MIPNPKYKGPWIHPKIPNPDFKEDMEIYHYKSAGLFFDLWQVKSGTIFDDIIVTDSVEEAQAFAEETFLKKKDAEAAAKKKFDANNESKEKAEAKENAEAPPEDAAEKVSDDEDEGHDEL